MASQTEEQSELPQALTSPAQQQPAETSQDTDQSSLAYSRPHTHIERNEDFVHASQVAFLHNRPGMHLAPCTGKESLHAIVQALYTHMELPPQLSLCLSDARE